MFLSAITGYFGVNKTSGEVYVKKKLDRETTAVFSLVIGALNYETRASHNNSQAKIDGKLPFLNKIYAAFRQRFQTKYPLITI